MFPWIHPFGCDAPSSLGRVYSRQATTWNCVRSAVSFVMKYCPFSTTLRNPASIQNLLKLSCCDSFSIRYPSCCNRKIFIRWVITIQRNFCLDHTEHEWGTWVSHHNGSPRSLVKEFILTYQRDCSVNTELGCRDNYAKNSLNRFQIGCIVYRQLCPLLLNDHCPFSKSSSVQRYEFSLAFARHSVSLSFVPQGMSLVFLLIWTVNFWLLHWAATCGIPGK